MPWCPKCKNEYRAGITVCPDCNETLVDELTEETQEYVSLFQTINEEQKNKLVKYLIHCNHKVKEESGMMETEEGNQLVYTIFVPEQDATEAMREIQTALLYEAKQDAGEEDLKPRHRAPEPSTVYVDAKSRYQEYKSTGIMFLVFAVAFFLLGILSINGMVPFMASPVSIVVIFLAAIAFIYIGVTSLQKSSSLKEEASDEEQTTDAVMEYLKTNFSVEQLLAENKENLEGEMLYFYFMELMKDEVSKEFSETDENFLDALLEDYYNTLDL